MVLHIPPGKKNFNVQLLPQDDHLESNRSVGMAALHCPEVATTPPVEKYQYFGQKFIRSISVTDLCSFWRYVPILMRG
jgi:hypothetical protein